MTLRHWTIIVALNGGYTPRDVAPLVWVALYHKGYANYSNVREYHVTQSSLVRLETALKRYAYWVSSAFDEGEFRGWSGKTYRQVYVLPEDKASRKDE